MNKTLIAVAAALGFTALPSVSFAEDAAPLTANIGVFTDYRYRGISQTRLKPAIQGGVDYAAANGLYVGVWASNIKWIKDGGGDASVEIDLYGGYKGEIQKDFTYDIGFLTYQYPGHKLPTSPNTNEIYGALTYGLPRSNTRTA
jgi:uncharacterized protein (TIGR02001 family)